MLANMEVIDLLDKSEALGQMVLDSDVKQEFDQAKQRMENDQEAQHLIKQFNNMKESYDEVERFGRYHPDYSKIMKEIRVAKREMDMHDTIATYKLAETNLQKLLDEISQLVAFSVSDKVKVPMDGAALTDGGCGCGSGGGGCGCKAS
ncbi:YlbF family regulator [Gracilibacillus caseinilyticus]|uniref:YlbF family regulator n=1 Tax=Gracilibacillus caseinilyticus TaxID=2932256 RepID=A0ABY4EU85_9BACI|nr:YlbF family regulator [Gracilibacillus caseinilyticus]UOQ47978.1 YlbF family regulator [Gracilibacillus caseinilyticus]